MYVISQAPSAAPITLAAGAATAVFNVIAGEPGAGSQCNLSLPGSNRMVGQPFIVRASGIVTFPAGTNTTAATPLQFEISASNTASFAVATGNVVASATAIAAFTWASATAQTAPWMIELTYPGGGGGLMLGKSNFLNADPNGVVLGGIAPVATIHSPSSLSWSNEPPVQFSVGVITAAVNLLNSATVSLTSFIVEA